jgi:Reverse transcriptase (RNA-dependent DNA polymerase)
MDDCSRRVFGFLCKSTDEWLDIWKQFVVMIEAEIGRPNCISWILSDNGSVYSSYAMAAFCAEKGIQQRFSAPYSQWMNGTVERNMRTVGEMAVTTIIHANLPKRAWGWATLQACEVLNRTIEHAAGSPASGTPQATRLERWKCASLPGQTKGLYPFGCLAFKHVPAALRSKLDMHAVPMVYLGLDHQSRSYLLGTLFDLHTSVSVEVTFFEDVFPFRKHKGDESPASLLWGADTSLLQGDPRLGMFDASLSQPLAPLDANTLKSIGAMPSRPSKSVVARGGIAHAAGSASNSSSRPQSKRPQPRMHLDEPVASVSHPEGTSAPSDALLHGPAADVKLPDSRPPAFGTVTPPPAGSGRKSSGPAPQVVSDHADTVDEGIHRPRDVWDSHVSLRYLTHHLPSPQADAKAVWQQPYAYNPAERGTFSDARGLWQQGVPTTLSNDENAFAASEDSSPHAILITITEASLQTITPRHVTEALRSPQRKMWLLAMQREKDCHVKNGTFGREMQTLGRQPPDLKPIPADWIFKIKHRGGPIEVAKLDERQFKARVVIRGQFMKEGIDFNDTFAPVAKPATVRTLLAFATVNACKLAVGDIETAFLTADMDCEVWVKMPPFWGNSAGPVDPNVSAAKPRLLLKGVPGIPQGSRLFHQTFASHLLGMGFKPSDADRCLFFKHNATERIAVLLWVDDFIIMYENEATFTSFLAQLRRKFTVPSVGPLKCFLGMEVHYHPAAKEMYINQGHTASVLLERAGMTDCNPVTTPAPAGAVYTKEDSPADSAKNTSTTLYRSLIALANFLSCWTRPDITFAVNKLCKFMSNPGEAHWKLLKHLIRYIRGTVNLGLYYHAKSHPGKLVGYTDSSYADCPDTGRSTLAYAFFYGQSAVSWYSKLNTYVTTCTNHSEYAALALGAKEAEWFVTLMHQLDPANPQVPVPIFVDNAGIVSMVFNPVDHQANKHVKISCHYTRELTEQKIIVPVRVPSEHNTADVFTKPLQAQQFKNLTSTLMREQVTNINRFASLTAPTLPIKHEQGTSVAVTTSQPAVTTYCSNIKREPVDTPSAVALMVTADDDQGEGDEGESDHSDAAVREYKGNTSDFQDKWPYPAALKKLLGASGYDVRNTGAKFGTGRDKLEVIFFRMNAKGIKIELSRHDGMQLQSRAGGSYIVCSRVPSKPRTSPTTINLTPPTPCLTCMKCGMINTPVFALIECTSCNGSSFDWSCTCVQSTALKEEPPKAPTIANDALRSPAPLSHVTPPRRPGSHSSAGRAAPRRPPALALYASSPPSDLQGVPSPPKRLPRQSSGKTWTKQIKYIGPLGRFTEYHEMECPTTAGSSGTLTATIEFANAYNLKPAPCCH